MTTLGETLRQYISEQDKQVALARRWLELWAARFPKKRSWSPDTIESHLSRTLKNDPQGIRFFFEDLARADLLLEVLGVPEAERDRVRAIAANVQRPGPRLVVDISSWPTRGEALDALFTELRQKVLRESALKPIALILTDEQYERLPRSYDEQIAQKHLVIHKIAAAAEGPPLVTGLAADDALVLAPWQFNPLERWLAADFAKGALSLAPEDGLAVFTEHGVFPAIPAVEHPLEAICEPAPVTFQAAKFTAIQRRFWLYTLASEAHTTAAFKNNKDIQIPGKRLALARELGAAATSTARERLDHELDQLAVRIGSALDLVVDHVDAAVHAERLARASLRPTPAAAWRCADIIHLLNVDAPLDHPRIVVHRPVAAVPALTRLLAHIADWTEEDHEADPSLARAVETLDPDGRERPAFLHARATLLWNALDDDPCTAPPSDRWAEELRAVLAADPPPASLRLYLPEQTDDEISASKGAYLAFTDDDRLTAGRALLPASLRRPYGRRTVIADRERGALHVAFEMSTYPLSIDTGSYDSIAVRFNHYDEFRIHADADHISYNRSQGRMPPSVWIPQLAEADVDHWLDCLERSSALSGWQWNDLSRSEKLLRSTGEANFELLDGRPKNDRPVEVADTTWIEADLLLAQCWLALRAALARPLSLKLASGVVCSLGAGVCAHLDVRARRAGAPGDITAAFDAAVTTPTHQTSAAAIDYRTLWTHSAKVDHYHADFGLRVPARLVLRTPTFTATITFLASPLLQASSPAVIGTLAAVTAARVADEEAEQNYDDD